jgi:PAP2 superfamily C-terminal
VEPGAGRLALYALLQAAARPSPSQACLTEYGHGDGTAPPSARTARTDLPALLVAKRARWLSTAAPPAAMAAHSPLREAATHVVLRLRSEVALLVAQLRVILAAVLYLVYFGYMLFRNLAFYNFTPGPVLHDLGHAAIPALGPTLHAVAEVPMAVLYVLITAMSLATFVPAPPTAPSKPYFVNMFRRFVVVLCLGHTLRFLSYALTSLPGAAAHCLPENIASITPPQPTTVAEVLTRYAARPGSNCGDLVFSGHMLQAILFALIVARYAQRCFAIADSTHLLLCAAVSALVAVQAVFVVAGASPPAPRRARARPLTARPPLTSIPSHSISSVVLLPRAARNHYTVDIVVASYTTPLLWYFYCRELQPTDLDLSAAPAVLPTTAPPKRRRRPSSADSAFSDVAADEAEDTCLL